MRRFYTFLLLFFTQISFATTFYVSGEQGNNSNNGLSEENPFLTIQTAADLTRPGDTVFIMNGVYTNDNMYNVFSIVNWGEPGAWITYTALAGHSPKLKFNSFDGIGVFGACYVEISGLEIQGANDETTLDFALENRLNLQVAEVRGRGIAIGPANGIDPHHIKLLNNKIYKCGGSGIHTYLTDYIIVENNEVYECGWYSSLQESGIHLIQNRDSDTNHGLKNFIRNNYIHSNFTYVPSSYDNTFYNGDGILVDDSRHVFRNTNIPSYQGITLIENNITFNNGGSGINAIQSDNILMVNNTAYKNSMNPGFDSYQIGAALSGNILMHNNIIVTQTDGAPYGCFDCDGFDGDYNLLFNTNYFPFLGENDITGEDPLFMNPSSDPNLADFSLLDGSPAQNVAYASNAASHDFFGNRRKPTPDLGAIERLDQTRSDCEAGAVFGTADKTVLFICSSNSSTNDLEFFNSSSSEKNYAYIITDTLDRVLAINETTYDFDATNLGLFFVYGVTYEGELNLSVGENLNTLSSTGDCLDISENHLQIYKEDMAGGNIATLDGEIEVNVTVNDTIPDLILLQQDISESLPVVYFLTDTAGIVLAIDDQGFEMEGVGEGTYFIGGAVYTGNLILQNGIHINLQAVSDDCFTYAFNFVKIINQSITELPPPPPPVLDGGEVRILGSQGNADLCLGETTSSELSFAHNTISTAGYVYVVTDEADRIIYISTVNNIDFADFTCSTCVVGGVSYTGEITAQIGDEFSTIAFSDEAYNISTDQVQVNRILIDGGMVSTTDGQFVVDIITSGDDTADLLEVTTNAMTAEKYAYLLTDTAGVILEIKDFNLFNFNTVADGSYFIDGLNYSGTLTAEIGKQLNSHLLSDGCFALSNSTIQVNRITIEVDGGEVRILDGQETADLCLGETAFNELTFAHSTTSTEAYAYVITDEEGAIVEISTANSIDFADFTCSTCTVGGVSYTGEIIAEIGDELSDVDFSDGIYNISEDQVQVNRILIDGGEISTADGLSVIDITTIGEETVDLLTIINDATESENYVYLLTDTVGVILEVTDENLFDFNELPDGSYFIYGLNYSGELTVEIGVHMNNQSLVDGCYALSSSTIQVNRTTLEVIVDGGEVRILGGEETVDLCMGEIASSELTFVHNTISIAEYAYVITDEEGTIVEISTTNSIDFADLTCSICLVGGVSYTGEVIAEVGDELSDIDFSNGTYNISNDLVQVNRIQINGGLVSTVDGRFVVDIITSGDEIADLVEVTNNTITTEKYAYLLTDTAGLILEIVDSNLFDFNELANGNYFIYGLNYSGELTAEIGKDINDHLLADGCHALSNSTIQVNRTKIVVVVDGGQVKILGGGEIADLCLDETASNELTFNYFSTSTEEYAYVITDEEGTIVEISIENSIDFADFTCSTCLVGGVSYTGEITAEVGDDLSTIDFSDEIYHISEDRVQVNRIQLDGGEISTADGASIIDVTTRGDETADLVAILNNVTEFENYAYLLTDTLGVILKVTNGNRFDFNELTDGSYLIYGLNYRGTLTAEIGEPLNSHSLADGCFALSNSTIQVNRAILEVILDGGQVSILGGQETADLCLGATTSNELTFAHNTISTAAYAYVVIDEEGKIVKISTANNIDFANFTCSTCMVGGVSYTGDVTAEVGDDLSTIAFSDGTYNISADQVQVNRILTDGGEISTADGQSVIDITTIGEETVDLIEVINTVMDAENYAYLLTNMDGIILEIVLENRFDFNKIGTGRYLIYGLNYAGNLTAEIGRDMDDHPLADGCFALSNSTIQVNRTTLDVTVDGGQIALTNEQLSITLCVGGGRNEFISVKQNSNGIGDQYKFIITDADNRLLEIMQTDSTSFESAVDGVCFIKGVSYAGAIVAKLGDNLDSQPFASGNYAFSQNEIEVTRIGVDGGHLSTTTGEIEASFCEEDDVSDVLHLEYETTSEKPYALTVIDGAGVLLDIIHGTTVDFSKYERGFYFIRGVSYTGDVFIELGQDQSLIPFSTGCFNHSNSVQIYWVGTADDCLTTTSLNDFDQYQFEMRLSPNPAQDYVRIEFDNPLGNNESGLVEIYNFNGQLIQHQPIQAWSEKNTVDIDINAYHNGIYMAKIQLGNYWGYQKFVKGN